MSPCIMLPRMLAESRLGEVIYSQRLDLALKCFWHVDFYPGVQVVAVRVIDGIHDVGLLPGCRASG